MKRTGSPPKDRSRTARRTRIAAQSVAGESVTEIAKAEGLSRVWTSKELAAPETQAIVARLVDASSFRMAVMFDQALTAISDALRANKEYVVGGVIEEGGPDHYARLKAAQTLTDLIKAGRAATRAPDSEDGKRRLLTLDEIEQAIAANRNRE